jgi:hypothetical protein
MSARNIPCSLLGNTLFNMHGINSKENFEKIFIPLRTKASFADQETGCTYPVPKIQ